MATYEGNMDGDVETASGRRDEALLSTAHGAADNGGSCAVTGADGVVDSRARVDDSATSIGKWAYPEPDHPSPSSASSRDGCLDDPPVTAQMLQVLELGHVIKNPKLRHDINFDPYLHFRPNNDTIRGERKRRQTEAYWAALEQDLERCATFDRRSPSEAPEIPPRLRRLLNEIANILRTLVPERDKEAIEDTLDLTLLSQQITRSSLDYARLAGWLAGVLKTHCAPMRDNWVDEMVVQFRRAAHDGDQSTLVHGIRTLFGILEAMKLDVANHQVRNLRTLLVEDTVNFERHLFERAIKKGWLDVVSVRGWYGRVQRTPLPAASSRPAHGSLHVAALVREVVDQLAPSRFGPQLPQTFELDRERIHAMGSEVLAGVALEVCIYSFERFMHDEFGDEKVPPRTMHTLRTRLPPQIDDVGGVGDPACPPLRVDELALEMGNIVAQTRMRRGHCSKGAREELVGKMQAHLRRRLRLDSPEWKRFEGVAMRLLASETFGHTCSFLDQSLLAVAMAQAPDLGTSGGLGPSRSTLTARGTAASASTGSLLLSSSFEAMLGDIAKRLAHVLTLHWRVFAPTVYLRPDLDAVEAEDGHHDDENGDYDDYDDYQDDFSDEDDVDPTRPCHSPVCNGAKVVTISGPHTSADTPIVSPLSCRSPSSVSIRATSDDDDEGDGEHRSEEDEEEPRADNDDDDDEQQQQQDTDKNVAAQQMHRNPPMNHL